MPAPALVSLPTFEVWSTRAPESVIVRPVAASTESRVSNVTPAVPSDRPTEADQFWPKAPMVVAAVGLPRMIVLVAAPAFEKPIWAVPPPMLTRLTAKVVIVPAALALLNPPVMLIVPVPAMVIALAVDWLKAALVLLAPVEERFSVPLTVKEDGFQELLKLSALTVAPDAMVQEVPVALAVLRAPTLRVPPLALNEPLPLIATLVSVLLPPLMTSDWPPPTVMAPAVPPAISRRPALLRVTVLVRRVPLESLSVPALTEAALARLLPLAMTTVPPATVVEPV